MIERPPNIRHLAAFSATLAHGTVTAAARAVNLTQPALSQAIVRLERELNCRLFDREAGGMRPTGPARLLGPRVERALQLIGSPRVTATQMRAFIALARSGSYAAAVPLTGVSAASVHRAVNDLGIALGERLVERRGQYVSLTRKGRQRARGFGLALAELRSGQGEIAASLGRSAGRVVIGAMPLSRAQWLPRAIRTFGGLHPSGTIIVREGSYAELVGPLRDGDIDLLLGALRPGHSSEDLALEAVFEDHPQIAMRADHPLAAKRPSVELLRRQSWVLPAVQTPLRQFWEQMLGGSDHAPPVGIECGSVLTIRELLLASDMLTLLSPAQLRVEIASGLVVTVPPPADIARTIGITTRLHWHPTASQQAMIDILRADGARNS
jgi:DNA-binding transcriptional LysR family regulator